MALSHHWSLIFRLALLSGAAALITQDAEATNYPLYCNGMKTLTLEQTANGGPVLTGSFFAAPQKRDAAAPPLFSCAWHDRVLKSTEPTCIAFAHAKQTTFTLTDELTGGYRIDSQDLSTPEGGIVAAFNGERVTFSIGPGDPNNGGCLTPVSVSFGN